MLEQFTPSALLGFLVLLLGYFIKKWICSLETKIDRISMALEKKVDKSELRDQLLTITTKCERKEIELTNLYGSLNNKVDEKQFLRHSHTEDKGIVL